MIEHMIYRIVNAAGQTVYVGRTHNLAARVDAHKADGVYTPGCRAEVVRTVTCTEQVANKIEEVETLMALAAGEPLLNTRAGRQYIIRPGVNALADVRRAGVTLYICMETCEAMCSSATAKLLGRFNQVNWTKFIVRKHLDTTTWQPLHGLHWRLVPVDRVTEADVVNLLPRPSVLGAQLFADNTRKPWTVYTVTDAGQVIYVGITTGSLNFRLAQHVRAGGKLEHRCGHPLTINTHRLLPYATLTEAYAAETLAIDDFQQAGCQLDNADEQRIVSDAHRVPLDLLTPAELAFAMAEAETIVASRARYARLAGHVSPDIVVDQPLTADVLHDPRPKVCEVRRKVDDRVVYVGRAEVVNRLWTVSMTGRKHSSFTTAEGVGLVVHVVALAEDEADARARCHKLITAYREAGEPLRNMRFKNM